MSVPRPEHTPDGDPCKRCKLAAARHRKRVRPKRARDRTEYRRQYHKTHPRHIPNGNPCSLCDLPAAVHRNRERAKYRKAHPKHIPDGDPCIRCDLPASMHRNRHKARKLPAGPIQIIGLDGEGYTLKNGEHRYVYLAACDENSLVAELRDRRGIKFDAFANWLIDKLPGRALLVAFSFGYDRTKLVESLSNALIYGLHRPELRAGKFGPRPCGRGTRWRVNLMGSLFTVQRVEDWKRRRIWDLFKFFQSSFVVALEKWGIGTPRQRAEILRMKNKRGSFAGIGRREERYCQSECMLLAKLASALIAAHEAEDLKLTAFHGPGSTASLILKSCGAEEQNAPIPDERAIYSAYFGGRFEVSRLGPVPAPIYMYDIASAYPYALAQLPCFAHGRWKWVDKWDGEPWSCVRYRINPYYDSCRAWGPLPFRTDGGHILFPVATGGGWAWDPEVRAAQVLHKGVETLGAWVWRSRCKHPPPFQGRIVDLFERRRAWGKASRGIVLKLGLNSMYGKSAQQVGSPRYRCMVRAGIITSITRAMLLGAIANARDPWNILELATDSLLSREPLIFPSSPLGYLGQWEQKVWDGGAFLMQPGMRFAVDASADIGRTAARGLGVRTLHKNRAKVLRAWEGQPMALVTLQQPPIFYGAKTCTNKVKGEVWPDGFTPWEYLRSENYGRWILPKPRRFRYNPRPKRCEVLTDFRLLPWERDMTTTSLAYDGKGEPYETFLGASPEERHESLEKGHDLDDEQPDGKMDRWV